GLDAAGGGGAGRVRRLLPVPALLAAGDVAEGQGGALPGDGEPVPARADAGGVRAGADRARLPGAAAQQRDRVRGDGGDRDRGRAADRLPDHAAEDLLAGAGGDPELGAVAALPAPD